ncbi:class I SAM-dependent methyltransferase [Limibacter armeniacum]|uniref:class I SAM-dependent methyltransferase n=1 Tax=Limibacter armeniacum TaxID=466084 RepID=UPI002FE639D0
MEQVRKPFQGTWNIIRFNWHFYVIAIIILIGLQILKSQSEIVAPHYLQTISLLVISSIVISLFVSSYIYDFSDLYKLNWLNTLDQDKSLNIINIHAGFDETSLLLKQKFQQANLTVFDFYDPLKHTEISIKRARKVYSPYEGTQTVMTTDLPLAEKSIDQVFTLLSAHEIRNKKERVRFFRELYRALKPDGKITVTEHLQDTANFLAYNIGFLHFHSRKTWLDTFRAAGLEVVEEFKITPFITTFILQKYGTTT